MNELELEKKRNKIIDSIISKKFKSLGFESVTEIQKKAIPKILQEKNCLIIAPTGSGKTECATIPIFSKLTQSKNIPIIITNQIFSNDDTNYDRMYMQLENYIHQKIQLEKIKNNYTCKILSPFINEIKFDYKITNSGIEATESI